MEFKNVLLVSSAALALTAASTAQAGDYFTVFGGATFQSDVDAHKTFTGTNAGLTSSGFVYYHTAYYASVDFSAELDSGFVLGAAYGRDFNRFWRMELELAYRENQVQGNGDYTVLTWTYNTFTTIKGYVGYGSSGPYTSTGNDVPLDGSTSFFSIMANFWYDFNIAGPWETFVGAGIGMAQANVNNLEINYGGYYTTQIADGSDWVFAYQFAVGAGYHLDNGIRLSAQYRYFGTEEADIPGVGLQGEASEFLFGISFPLGN